MKHIICFSKGHSSARVAIEVVRRYGKQDVILLNHGINPAYEDADIKRFGREVADYLGLPITYANYKGVETEEQIPSQFQISIESSGFKVPETGDALCTNRLKTKPFEAYLAQHHKHQDCIIYYGFDKGEEARKARREAILGLKGYETAYPLIDWEITLSSTLQVGIQPPLTYSQYKHANCKGCLKAGFQHWYVTYCAQPSIFQEAKAAELITGYAILKTEKTIRGKRKVMPVRLLEIEDTFRRMKCDGVPASEHYNPQLFKKALKHYGVDDEWRLFKPCECLT